MTSQPSSESEPKPRVFIHVNHKQIVGALVGIQSIRAKLRHWRIEQQFCEMFDGSRDYKKWITLSDEERDTIGLLDERCPHRTAPQ